MAIPFELAELDKPKSDASVVLATSLVPRLSRIRPNGTDVGLSYQRSCYESWSKVADEVISFNTSEEIDRLRSNLPDGTFFEVERTGIEEFGRPLIYLSDVLNALKNTQADIVGIVNSDVMFAGKESDSQELIDLAQRGIVAINRSEVADLHSKSDYVYRYGYDAFLFPRRIIDELDMEGFAIGAPWWDYWMLLNAALRGLVPFIVKRKVCAHLTHPQKWNVDLWWRTLDLSFEKMRHLITQDLRAISRSGEHPFALQAMAEFVFFLRQQARRDQLPGLAAGFIGEPIGVLWGLFCVEYSERAGYIVE